MLVIDMPKQDGRRLHVIAACVAGGLLLLLGGLWFVQIVHAQRFANNLKRQSFRTVRMPAIRGQILDCRGRVLAADKPRYNAILYLEDLQGRFDERYANLLADYAREHPEAVTRKGRIVLPTGARRRLQLEADCDVVSNITFRVSTTLNEPRVLNTNAFLRHYNNYPYVPFQIVPDLASNQVAIFSEQLSGQPDVDLETQPVRVYPNGALAAHLLGFVQRMEPLDGAEVSFTMPDFEGRSGVERVFDVQLRGQPGVKSVLVNNQNYRQREEIETPNQPGEDIYLTIDLPLQRAAEQALAGAQANVRGAVVVLDPRNGDLLALVSAPSFDPNSFVPGVTPEEYARLNDPKYKPQFNRAVTGAYFPGSTFKIITALACLESGLDPKEIYDSPGEYRASPTARPIGDTAGAGPFNFERAFFRSSNTYFIHYGMRAGLPKILEVAKRFHLGEKTGLETKQEVAGSVPGPDKIGRWFSQSAADVCIGQEITATPLQMALMVGAIANGGTLYWPRVASRTRAPETGDVQELRGQGRVRDHVFMDPRHLELIRHAMLEDTEHPPDHLGKGGTAYDYFHHPGGAPYLGKFRVAGKTGTAEVKSSGSPYKRVTWFDSYGPYEDPRYVVVVMVEDGAFGGPTCAPVARKIYEAIVKEEQGTPAKASTLARN